MDLSSWYQIMDEHWTKEMDEATADGFWRKDWWPDMGSHCKSIEEMMQQSMKYGLFRAACAAAMELYALGLYESLADSVAAVTHFAIQTPRYDACLTRFCESIYPLEIFAI